MTPDPANGAPNERALLDLYDDAVGEVFGYLVRRCGSMSLAEDLTSETFLAAVQSLRRGTVAEPTVPWLIGIARHKLVDHWRRREREERKLTAIAGEAADVDIDDWDVRLDALRAHDVLGVLAPQHRAALTLRYLDGLAVPEMAPVLGRTVKATEVLLVRARRAFRTAYETDGGVS